jgi:hypothetical protein
LIVTELPASGHAATERHDKDCIHFTQSLQKPSPSGKISVNSSSQFGNGRAVDGYENGYTTALI